MARERKMITCPCCHGTGWMVWFEENTSNVERRDPCGHCEGTGEIEGEVEENGNISRHHTKNS